MNKYKILIISLICLSLLTNSVLAEEFGWDLNYTERRLVTIPSDLLYEFPTPVLTKFIKDCTLEDCRNDKITDAKGRTIPYYPIDLDKNGIPEYQFFIVPYLDISSQPSNIEYSNLTPKIKYKNQTLINKFDTCYKKENSTICLSNWKETENFSDIDFDVRVFPMDIINRFDLYTIVKFNSSPAVNYFCPLVLDLDNWPRYIIFLRDKELRGETEIGVKPALHRMENLVVYDGRIIYMTENNEVLEIAPEVVYDGQLILVSPNRSIIITKPSIGRFIPSPDYFFKTEILLNGNVQASVCTTNHTGELLPPKGPNAYIVFGEPDIQKLVRMSIYLGNIPEPILHPPESIKTKFFKGSVWPLGRVTFPEIVPEIELKAEENFYNNITFAWMKQEGKVNITIPSKDGTLIFKQPILLNGSSWMYPLDTYETFVYYNPLVITNGNSSLSFDLGVPYQGTTTFKDGKISFLIKRNDDSKNKYFLYLIFCGLIFLFSNWHIKNLNKYSFQPKKLLEKLGLIGSPLFGYFFFISDIQYSIGTIPYVIMVLWLTICFYSKWKNITR